jgi:AcrR family transcriptional regulator
VRADAMRNRAKVLEVAAEAFASEGLSVPVYEIARRAGVGTGTVGRHFPTKDDLFAAVLVDRIQRLVERADALDDDSGDAFFTFFATLVREAATHRGLAEALAGSGFDADAAAKRDGADVGARLQQLLSGAQEAGAVRNGVTYADVKALMKACLLREDADAEALERMINVVCDGLRPQ